jgi:hypothetical protein
MIGRCAAGESHVKEKCMPSSLKLFIIIAVIVFAPLLIAHRTGIFGKAGQFIPSKEVNSRLRGNALPPGYRYFELSDSTMGTYAIAGIDPAYIIDAVGWKEFSPAEGALDGLIQRMVMQNAYTAEGYRIVSPDRETVGIFYSPLPDPVVHFKPRRRIKFALETPQHIRQDK